MELSKLKPHIKNRLETLTDIDIYDGVAKTGAEYPYLIYTFPFPGTNEIRQTRTDRIMEIDFWNDSNDDTTVLEAAENIKNGRTVDEIEYYGLNNSSQVETEGFYKCYIDGDTYEIKDPNKDIVHLKQRYLFHIG